MCNTYIGMRQTHNIVSSDPTKNYCNYLTIILFTSDNTK